MGDPHRFNIRSWALSVGLAALLIAAAFAGAYLANKPRIPTEGVQVEISHASSTTYRISNKGQVLATIPVRTVQGREVKPTKAVVHQDILYILYEDDSVIELRNPEPNSFEDWARQYGRPVAENGSGIPHGSNNGQGHEHKGDAAQPVVVSASQVINRQIGYIPCVAFVPGRESALIAGTEGKIQLINLATGEVVRTMLGHEETVWGLAVSSDGQYAVTASSDKTVRVWKVDTGEQVRVLRDYKEFGGDFTSVALSADSSYLAAGCGDGTVSLWDFQSGRLLHRLQRGWIKTPIPSGPHQWEGHRGPITSVVFSSDGRYMATTAKDPIAKLWETETGVNVGVFKGHRMDVNGVAFAPDGKVLATGGWDNTFKLWEVHNREWADGNYNWLGKLKGTGVGHTNEVRALKYSPDGRFLFTASYDGTARQWDAHTGREVARFEGHKGPVLSLDVNTTGTLLVTGGEDGTIRLWSPQQ